MAKKRKSGRKRATARKLPVPPGLGFDEEEFWNAVFSPPTADLRLLADPRQWSSEIPELRYRPLTREEHAQVVECMAAIDVVLARGVTVAMRMEFAAAMVASACAIAYSSAAAQGASDGPDRFASAEGLIVRRARELYGQGRA